MLKGILAIAGQPGLFKVVAEGRNSVVVESLLTGKRSTAYADAKMSTLEDIAIYTVHEDMPLKKVLRKIYDHEQGGVALNGQFTPESLKQYFQTVLPEYDRDRVYGSDIKKVLSWYNLLNEKNMLDFSEEEPGGANESVPSEK